MRQYLCKCGCFDILEECTNVTTRRWLYIDDMGEIAVFPEEDAEVFGSTEYKCASCGEHIADSYNELVEQLEE